MDISNAKRIVVKIGSALVVNQATGHLRSEWLASLVEDVARLCKSGKQVVIVTSGAVALGRKHIGKSRKPKLEEKQAAAACGQIELLEGYKQHFAIQGMNVAQILLTIEDSEDRRRYLNARSTLETLLKRGIIPIVNENDTVATAELRFGDNDRLSARVAQMVGADVLVLLSDIDGLYTANPHVDKNAVHLPAVAEITKDIEAMAGGSASAVGSGGMVTKIAAAKIAVGSGCSMVITRGEVLNPLRALEVGAKCTWFKPKGTPQGARKHWIAAILHPAGEIVVDDGALKALKTGNSLLPAGVVQVSGSFQRGDAVTVKDKEGNAIARGLIAYSSEDAKCIMGKKSTQIEEVLGFLRQHELIHRDDMVML